MNVRPKLIVNLDAIVRNWQLLAGRFCGAECGAVVKADAYGLGMQAVSGALAKAGCHTFFVASFDEAMLLRGYLPDARIVIFHGVAEGEALACVNHRLIPALADHAQIARWQEVAANHKHAASLLHIDTGMARLGLQMDDFFALLDKTPELLQKTRAAAIMSHFACAPTAAHPLNASQRDMVQKLAARCGDLPISLCNSGGIFLDDSYHFDLARPGCALYGIRPSEDIPNPMHQVAQWRAPILQIRTLNAEQSVGYGATQTLPKNSKILTIASGYADGYLRGLSHKALGYIANHKVPLVGRVTMDMLCFDVSNIPDQDLEDAQYLALIDDEDGIRVDDLADAANTIGYEIFTRIGARVIREYQTA
jgi:alanine racemase